MEKETPVTAEDFYHSQAEFNRWLRDLMPHEKSHLKYMLEEYGQMYAEQARREAINSLHIEIHNKIVETRVELYKATQNEIVDRKLYDLDVFIGQKADAATGYGKKEA